MFDFQRRYGIMESQKIRRLSRFGTIIEQLHMIWFVVQFQSWVVEYVH